jgi:putative ABC transport system substrate-binding protein
MRRYFLAILVGLLFGPIVGMSAAQAQQKAVPRIAYVYIFKEGPSAPFSAEFLKRLRELWWIDGQNIVVDVRDAEGSPDKLNAIMRELVDSKVDVIVTACTPGSQGRRQIHEHDTDCHGGHRRSSRRGPRDEPR